MDDVDAEKYLNQSEDLGQFQVRLLDLASRGVQMTGDEALALAGVCMGEILDRAKPRGMGSPMVLASKSGVARKAHE